MRRIHLGIGAAVVALALTSATGAHALWGATRTVDAGVSSTGSFTVNAAWIGGAPAWQALFPNTSADGQIRVTQAGNGNTLGWRVRVSSTVSAEFAPHVTFQAWVGACGTGTPVPTDGYPAGGHLASGTTVDICVRHSLTSGAPGSLQGKSFNPQITVIGEQVGS